jgi:RHS repeat-associated protein
VLRTRSATYTLTGKPATATDANGNVTRFAYDLLDRPTSLTDAKGRLTSYGYDALSRRTQVLNTAIQANPLLQQGYTANGALASLTDANNNSTSFAYDGFDRLATTTYPGGSTETFTYDADSNVLSRKTRANDTIAFTYDTLNRLATKTPPPELLSKGPAPVVGYGYDLAGRLTGVSDTSAAVNPALPPAPSTSVQYATTTSYDALNRPTGVVWNPAPTAASPTASAVTFTHAYNKINQRAGQQASDNSWWYYPAATASTVSYTANALNQHTAVGAVTPSGACPRAGLRPDPGDGNGNLTGDGTVTYGYDAENRLTSASGAGNTASYAYDGQGRRKLKTVNGTTTVFVTDAGSREVLEYDGTSGQILRWYAYGLGSNDVLNQMDVVAATRATVIPDIQGSIIGTLDSGTGALSTRGYLPYGASASTTGSFAYTGQRIDAETSGFYYYRARMYATRWGRFLQVDPIAYQGGSNLYAYVNNDPLNRLDPFGLCDNPQGCGGGSTAAAGAIAIPGAAGGLGEIAAGIGGRAAAGAFALPVAIAAGSLAVTSTSTAGPEQDELLQYVVRAGVAAPASLQTGTTNTINGFGFSVQTSPGLSHETLASGAPNIHPIGNIVSLQYRSSRQYPA